MIQKSNKNACLRRVLRAFLVAACPLLEFSGVRFKQRLVEDEDIFVMMVKRGFYGLVGLSRTKPKPSGAHTESWTQPEAILSMCIEAKSEGKAGTATTSMVMAVAMRTEPCRP